MEYYIPLRTEGELKTIYFFTNKKIFIFKENGSPGIVESLTI
jgi:hypothetical protein